MKCPNCGFELRDTDKFCNECGTKVQHLTESDAVDEIVSEVNHCETEVNNSSQSNDKKILCKECEKFIVNKLKEVPPMCIMGKCPNCGKETNLNDIYCSHCMAALHTDDNNELNKIPFYKNLTFWILAIIIVAFMSVILITLAITSNTSNDDVTKTSFEQVDSTTAQKSYICYVINEVYFYVNSDWRYKKTDSGYLFNNYSDDKLMVDAKVLSKIVDDSDVEDYIKNIEKENNYKLKSDKLVTIYDDRTANNLKYNYTDNYDDSHYVNMFVFTNANTIYSVRFDSLGDSQSSNSIDVQDYLLKTLTISKSDFAEETTETETEPPTEKQKSDVSIGKINALKSAKSYLEYSSFSYKGLIKQLEYEKYSHEEAVYAADNCGADWKEQAVKSAASYLEYSSFSKDSLIEQLEYEGFTHEQAVYGVEQNGY